MNPQSNSNSFTKRLVGKETVVLHSHALEILVILVILKLERIGLEFYLTRLRRPLFSSKKVSSLLYIRFAGLQKVVRISRKEANVLGIMAV